MDTQFAASPLKRYVDSLAREVSRAGDLLGLPFIAVSADIGSPEPMLNAEGRPFAETIFRWIDPTLHYWKDRSFALRASTVHATRTCAEPFYYSNEKLGSWRPNATLDASNEPERYQEANIGTAIVAPAHLPGGKIGAVVWANSEAFDIRKKFDRYAEYLHALALKFVASYDEARDAGPKSPAVYLTRREIQCLKWAAAGKTDAEIATIIDISVPTVRFHITNSAKKLGVAGKARAIQRASVLGYIGNE